MIPGAALEKVPVYLDSSLNGPHGYMEVLVIEVLLATEVEFHSPHAECSWEN